MRVGRSILSSGVFLLILASSQARAWVEVCNGRGERANAAVAVGAKDPPGVSTGGHSGVTVEGWWTLSPGECARVSQVNASENWLYFHATSKSGNLHGESRLCVRNKSFNSSQQFLMGNRHCIGDWSEAGFVRRDTGAKNYRFHIT